jgi:predicted metal-dependent HD superfamily phosphohydrolase
MIIRRYPVLFALILIGCNSGIQDAPIVPQIAEPPGFSKKMSEAAMERTNHNEVEFGIWLHDVVYDPRASDNEEQSARIAGEILEQMDCPPKLITSIRELILATRHIHPPPTPDARLLVDIDLSILGQPPDVFGVYERAIRAEYSRVSEESYKIGRSRILRGFLDKPAIYCTDGFEKKYGLQARENIMKALAALER